MLSRINDVRPKQAFSRAMEPDLDILAIARWAISTYGGEAVPIIRRRAAENLLADDPEAAECWKRVAEAAGRFLGSRTLH